VAGFVVSALAVAGLAALVGRSVEQLGDRFGTDATGVLQSALGNLPELFVGFFALRAGLIQVIQAAILGSILGNLLLVRGLAVVGQAERSRRRGARRAATLAALAGGRAARRLWRGRRVRLGLVRGRAPAGDGAAPHLPGLRRAGGGGDRRQRGRERGRDPARG